MSSAAATTNGTHIDGDDLSKAPPTAAISHKFEALTIHDAEFATLGLHADDHLNFVHDVAPPIHVATTFRYSRNPDDLEPLSERADQVQVLKQNEHVYSRHTTPSSTRLEAVLSVLLRNPSLIYSSGLAALHALFTFLNPKTIAIGAGYHGSHDVLELHKRLTGCKQLPLDCSPDELGEGDLIHLETPVNPTGLTYDIQKYADIAHSRGAYLCVDSTFAPPPLQDPFKHGADIVMHSGTKYIGGHSDMLCGILAVKRKDWLPQLLLDRLHLGSVTGGLESWLGVRSIRTLELRVTRQSASAQHLVDALSGALTGHTVGTGLSQSDVSAITAVLDRVTHASLQPETDMVWLRRQMPRGYGPVFSLVMKRGDWAKRLPSKLRFFFHATSLGGVDSLIEWRRMTDPTVERTVLRVSVGVEDPGDLLADLIAGFRALVEVEERKHSGEENSDA